MKFELNLDSFIFFKKLLNACCVLNIILSPEDYNVNIGEKNLCLNGYALVEG